MNTWLVVFSVVNVGANIGSVNAEADVERDFNAGAGVAIVVNIGANILWF